MTRAESLAVQFRRERGWTYELVSAVPEERYDWAPAAGAFSCGGIVTHLILAELYFRQVLVAGERGESIDLLKVPGATVSERYGNFRPRNEAAAHSRRFGATFAACLEAWKPIGEETAQRIAGFSDEALENATATHAIAGLTTSLEHMVLTLMSHESHHRGQLSAYLKMLAVPQPPLFSGGR